MQVLHPSHCPTGNPLGHRRKLSNRWRAQWSHPHIGTRQCTTLLCRFTRSGQMLTEENEAACKANKEELNADSIAEIRHENQPVSRALEGRKPAAAAGEETEQGQDAAGKAEPTDGRKRKPHPLKGRKRPPEVGAKIAATKAALSPERRQQIGQKISKGRLKDPKVMSIAHRMKISQARLGQKHSQETIERMRISQSEWWDRQKAMKKQTLQQDSEAGLKQG